MIYRTIMIIKGINIISIIIMINNIIRVVRLQNNDDD